MNILNKAFYIYSSLVEHIVTCSKLHKSDNSFDSQTKKFCIQFHNSMEGSQNGIIGTDYITILDIEKTKTLHHTDLNRTTLLKGNVAALWTIGDPFLSQQWSSALLLVRAAHRGRGRKLYVFVLRHCAGETEEIKSSIYQIYCALHTLKMLPCLYPEA